MDNRQEIIERLKIYLESHTTEQVRSKFGISQILALFNAEQERLNKLALAVQEHEIEEAKKQERKAIQDFYQTKEGDIVIPKEDWQALKGE